MSEQLNTTKTFHYDASISGIPNVTIEYPSGHQLFDEHPDDEVCFPEMGLLTLCLDIAVLHYPCRWPPELAKYVRSSLMLEYRDEQDVLQMMFEAGNIKPWIDGEQQFLSKEMESNLRGLMLAKVRRIYHSYLLQGQEFDCGLRGIVENNLPKRASELPECNGEFPAIRLKYDPQTFYAFVE